MVRPKVHDEALRRRLLERAAAMLSDGGAAGVSLRVLARDCGTSTTAVYTLFGGKAGLLAALLDDAFHRFGLGLAAVLPGDDPVTDLVRLGAAYRRGALTDPHVFDAMFGGIAPEDAPAGAEPRPGALATALAPLRELVERAVAEKALRADLDPVAAARTLWATVHGWVSLQRRGLLPADPARFDDALLAVLDGWRTHGTASP